MIKLKKYKGITLIALVVTIVVLLILAGITISLVFSDDGIIGKARESAERTDESFVDEQERLNGLYDDMNEIIENVQNSMPSEPEEPSEDETYDVTITYSYAQGQEGTLVLPNTYKATNLPTGYSYYVTSPTIDGYVAVPLTVRGKIEDSDVNVSVLYYIDSNGNGVPDSQE